MLRVSEDFLGLSQGLAGMDLNTAIMRYPPLFPTFTNPKQPSLQNMIPANNCTGCSRSKTPALPVNHCGWGHKPEAKCTDLLPGRIGPRGLSAIYKARDCGHSGCEDSEKYSPTAPTTKT